MKSGKYKIAIVGDFAFGKNIYSGQTTKTRDYYTYFEERYGKQNIRCVDTRDWKKNIFKTVVALIGAMLFCNNLVLILCTNGRRTVLPFAMRFKTLLKYKVFFSVVGGDLMYEFDKEIYLKKNLQKIDGVYVETKAMTDYFERLGYKNVFHAPVFTHRDFVNTKNAVWSFSEPFPLCTYSRVCKEKGISSAIEAIIAINKKEKKVVCTLDVYGNPIEEYREEFNMLVEEAAGSVRQCDYLNDHNAIDNLANHYLMLFPTYYEGEGFPIAIVECLKAGLPVVATDWHYNSEVIKNRSTGVIYSDEKLEEVLSFLLNNPDFVEEMHNNCIEEAKRYEPHKILSILFDSIER